MAAPNLKEIEWAISELEKKESSEARYSLLAALYTCRRELTKDAAPETARYSLSAAPTQSMAAANETAGLYGSSDFLRAVARKAPDEAWQVMDELMETLLVVNRRVYDSVMRKMERR